MEEKKDEMSISEKQKTKKVRAGVGRVHCPHPSRKISVKLPGRIWCAPCKTGFRFSERREEEGYAISPENVQSNLIFMHRVTHKA